MTLKKTLMTMAATALACSVLFTSVVSAESISEQKLKLMIAAGEIPAVSDEAAKNAPEPKVSKEAAIEKAKKILENPSAYEVNYVSLNPSYGLSKNRTWNIELMRAKSGIGNASVAIDSETGEMLSFNIWENNDGQTNYIAKITKAEARVKAEDYIKNQLGESIGNYELQKEDPYMYGYRMGGVKEAVIYNFNYVKKVNDVPFTNYSISIGVDGVSGKIRSYNASRIPMDENKFPSKEGILSTDKALDAYKGLVNVKLQYITTYSNSPYGMSKPKVMLAYVPTTYTNMLDAKTGKPLSYDGNALDMTSEEVKNLLNNPVPMDPDAKLVDKAITEKDAKAKAEQYRKIVEGLLGVTFDNVDQNEYRPYYYANGNQEDVWSYNWYKNSETGHAYLNLSISGKTGHILSIGAGSYDNSYEIRMKEGKKPEIVVEKVKWDQGKEKALEILKKLAPEQYGFYADENIKQPQLSDENNKYMTDHGYSFTRVVNGLRFRDNSVNVNIDRQTGALKSLYLSWSDMEFPEKTTVISEEEATGKYFEGTEAKLIYFLETSYSTEGGPKYADVPKLAYTFSTKSSKYVYGSLVIDAITGKQTDISGNIIKIEPSVGEPNIAEHWAKRSGELLIAQGVLKNPEIDLDAKVTRAEAVKMLSLAKGMLYYYDGVNSLEASFADVPKDDEYFIYVENALKQKIVVKESNEFKGNEKLTKAEFVKLLINLLGYSDIAKHKDIFRADGMANISSEMTGYAAIASVLDILPVKPGSTFNGDDEVTYGEAAVALYKAMGLIK